MQKQYSMLFTFMNSVVKYKTIHHMTIKIKVTTEREEENGFGGVKL